MPNEFIALLQGALPHDGRTLAFFLVILFWSLTWKGWSLWLAARRKEPAWFILLLLANTIGLLDIIYIFFVAKKKDTK